MSEVAEAAGVALGEGDVNATSMVLCSDPSSPLWQEAADVEASVFIESGYVDSSDALRAEYAPYEPVSRLLALKVGSEVVGAARFIHYDPEIGFKTINDIEGGRLEVSAEGQQVISELDLTKTIEVGTIALKPECRTAYGGHFSMDMYGAIYGMSWALERPNVIASFDGDYFGGFQRLFGPAVKQLGPSKDYMGSKTVVAVIDIPGLKRHFEENGMSEFISALDEAGRTMKEA